MKIIKPSATLMEHNVHPYKFIEMVGRTCYKSEDLITEESAERFVGALVRSRHMAMLEHETLYVVASQWFMNAFLDDTIGQDKNSLKYFNITAQIGANIISGSFRSFYDLFWNENVKGTSIECLKNLLKKEYPLVFSVFDSEATNLFRDDECVVFTRDEFKLRFDGESDILFKHLIHTFKFVCDRGVTHEFVRHRPASYAQESTRYCNYSKDKFGNEITVILPCFFDTGMGEMTNSLVYDTWKHSCEVAERDYFKLIDMGAIPQEARSVLPTSLKTEIIITAPEYEWQHIVNLRLAGATGAPHPQIKEVMNFAINDLLRESEGRIIYEAD